MKTKKRTPGGQKGNQNARKHGFYSANLSQDELAELWQAVNVEHVDPHLALIRLKVKLFMQKEAGNPRLLAEAARLIANLSRTKYGFNREETDTLRLAIEAIWTRSLEESPSPPAPSPDID